MKNHFFIITIICLLLLACGGEEPQTKTYDYKRADSLPAQYTTHLGNIRVSIEEINRLNSLFKQNGYSYNSSTLNSPAKVSGYSDAKTQAINLGIYGSDVNYALAYDQTQDVLNYLKSIAELAKKLGIEKAFDETLVKKLTENADTTSDKSNLLTKAYRFAEDQLHSEERAAIATMMVFGGWVESIYITSSNLKQKPGSAEINQIAFDHLDTFNDVVEMIKAFEKTNKSCAELLTVVNEIAGTVDNLIRTKGNFSSENIETLYTTISGLRSKLI